MTTKVIESDDGVFATGMAVAPVTDWHYYGKMGELEPRSLLIVLMPCYRLYLHGAIYAYSGYEH
jgi:dipeptidyl aminopeptidase